MLTYNACGIELAAITPGEATAQIIDAARMRNRLEVHLCNAYTLSLVDTDPVLRAALRDAHLNLPDGAPVAWLGRHVGLRSPVRGPALLGSVMEAGVAHRIRHYLYGGKPSIAREMARRLMLKFPGVEIVGTESPPFHDLDTEALEELSRRIRESEAHVVWVGLGTPRQDHLVPRLSRELGLPVIPVGAAFDFWSGHVAEAPAVLHGTGLEWMYRFAKEPRRLWRRYLIGNPRFVRNVLRHRRLSLDP